jgi:hypothetical protein
VCAELFFDPLAQTSDDNLLFVRERLLRSGVDLPGLLELYGEIHSKKKIRQDETNPLLDALRLSGAVKLSGDVWVVRNRIYRHVFDRRWVAAHMPDADVRRQREAYWKGVGRTAGIASLIIALAAILVSVGLERAAQRHRKREHDLLLSAANARAAVATETNEALRKQLARLTGSSPSFVLAGTSGDGVPSDEPLRLARQIFRVAENRREISGRMTSHHRSVRRGLRRPTLIDRAYKNYPYERQIRAYDIMAVEASHASDLAAMLPLESLPRETLVKYLIAQARGYRELGHALSYEREKGYTAALPLWEFQRRSSWQPREQLRQQARKALWPERSQQLSRGGMGELGPVYLIARASG